MSAIRVLAALAAVMATLVGLDELLGALGAQGALREMVSTGLVALAMVLWPRWFVTVLPHLIPGKKRLSDPVPLERVTRLLRSFRAETAGMADPKVILVRSDKPAAMATGVPARSAIIVSSGLLEQLDDCELRGTLAHECAHVVGRHLMVTSGFLATLFFAKAILGPLGLPATLVLLLLYLWIVRRNEFDADKRGALMVGVEDMQQTLRRFQSLHKECRWMNLPWVTILSTHPGFGRRIRALDSASLKFAKKNSPRTPK